MITSRGSNPKWGKMFKTMKYPRHTNKRRLFVKEVVDNNAVKSVRYIGKKMSTFITYCISRTTAIFEDGPSKEDTLYLHKYMYLL